MTTNERLLIIIDKLYWFKDSLDDDAVEEYLQLLNRLQVLINK